MDNHKEIKQEIDQLTHYQLASIYRFAENGHKYFVDSEIYNYFMSRFNSLGGMTPQISKQIGFK